MSISGKSVFLSILYLLISVILILLVDLGLIWFIDNILFKLLNKFNHLETLWKVIILIFGGLGLFIAFLQTTQRITTLLGGLIFNKFPQNIFTITSTTILALINAAYFIYKLWNVPTHFNFWIVIELIILSLFIWSFSAIVMPAKEQLKFN